MAVYFYDKALVAKLKSWTENTQVTILGPQDSSRLFEILADENNDKPLQLPIISIVRVGGYTLNSTTKQPGTYSGIRLHANENKELVNLSKIPITISYRIDIYTRYLQEADEYLRELIFNFINHPTVKISIPYNGVEKEYNCTISLKAEVEDNSDIPERLISGQFTRMSLNIDIDDAYLYDIRVKTAPQIGGPNTIQMYKEQDSSDVIVEELLNV